MDMSDYRSFTGSLTVPSFGWCFNGHWDVCVCVCVCVCVVCMCVLVVSGCRSVTEH